VRRVGCLLELYRDVRSPKCTILWTISSTFGFAKRILLVIITLTLVSHNIDNLKKTALGRVTKGHLVVNDAVLFSKILVFKFWAIE
jgi:hypothetical protein